MPAFKTHVIIGDLNGNLSVLKKTLINLGCNIEKNFIPEDIVIIQTGNIISFEKILSNESAECLKIINKFIVNNSLSWIQLFGNKEIAILGGPRLPSWENNIHIESMLILFKWWDKQLGRFAASLCNKDGRNILVTHAGITFHLWFNEFSSMSSSDLAISFNNRVGKIDLRKINVGFDYNNIVNFNADPTWTNCYFELYPSWSSLSYAKFDQVHGHSTPINWKDGSVESGNGSDKRHYRYKRNSRVVTTHVNSTSFTSVDFDMNKNPFFGEYYTLVARENFLDKHLYLKY